MASNGTFNFSFVDVEYSSVPYHLTEDFAFYVNTVCMVFNEFFSIFGCFSNIVNMIVFKRQGFKDSINISLFALSVSDFGVSFTLIFENICFHPAVMEIDYLPFHPSEVGYVLFTWTHVVFVKITTVLTVLIVVERCMCVVMPLKIKSIITTRRVKMINIIIFISVMASFAPLFYANQLGWKFLPAQNRSIWGLVFAKNRQEIDLVLFFFHSFALSVTAFIIVIVCTSILYNNLKKKAIWRQTATAATQANEILTKDIKVARMVVLVSTLFVVCLFPYILFILAMAADSELSMTGKKYNFFISLGAFALVPESISSSVNIFFYYRNSSKYKSTYNTLFNRSKE